MGTGGLVPPVNMSQDPPQKQVGDNNITYTKVDNGNNQHNNNEVVLNSSQQNNNINNNSNIDLNNRYRATDQGPFYVYVEHKTKNIGRLFPIRVGSYLYVNKVYKNAIMDVNTIGRNRVKVILNSRKAANDLVGHELLIKQDLISYIPKFYTERKGVVRMVDTFFSEEYLVNAIECDREVSSVKRMTRKVKDKNTGELITVDRQMIVVSFQGTTLPQNIRINGVNFPVEVYRYPVVMCTLCLRYGHSATLCKSTKVRCKKCGDNHQTTDCESELQFCVYCKNNDHSSIAKTCPYFLKQKRIKQIMADKNLSFKEAESIENNPSYAKVVTNNRFNLLQTQNNFPELPPTTNFRNSKPVKKHSQAEPSTSHPSLTPHSTQVDKTQQVKRKARTNPPDYTSKRPPNLRQQTSPVIPNPHRDDFLNYKSRLEEQLTFFITQLLTSQIPKTTELPINLEHLNIKQQISALLSSFPLDRDDDTDDDTY